MLLFIASGLLLSDAESHIQIHLMLLFIAVAKSSPLAAARFKYISYYCLSALVLFKIVEKCIFKYISCYCLSAAERSEKQKTVYSNTSHVIVYHRSASSHSEQISFKYISCYCLSGTGRPGRDSGPAIQIHLMLLFILE